MTAQNTKQLGEPKPTLGQFLPPYIITIYGTLIITKVQKVRKHIHRAVVGTQYGIVNLKHIKY